MALIDKRPCPTHGLMIQHCNGVCMECTKDARAKVKERSDKHWQSLTIELKLNYLRNMIERN
jgi:hypothetical protein